MKIGVFGDSFASLKLNPSATWVEILSQRYNITNHAITGSNLYYSIAEIKKHHANYDKIILVVTAPGRMKIANWIPNIPLEERFINGPYDKKYFNKDSLNHYEESCWDTANNYFKYFQEQDYDKYIHNLMLTDIQKIRSDIVLIPGFTDSWYHVNQYSMFSIFLKENTAWGYDSTTVNTKYEDNRNCHMIAENNEIFATKVEGWINNVPVHINLDDFVTTTNKDLYLKLK